MEFLDYTGLSHYDEKIKDYIGSIDTNTIQVDTLPAASAELNGVIVQYVGATTSDLINGYFYRCNGSTWSQHNTQPIPTVNVIDDTTASASKTYSSNKITTLLSGKANTSAIPTATSDLTNDSDFVSDSNYVHTDNNFTNSDALAVGSIGNRVEKDINKGYYSENILFPQWTYNSSANSLQITTMDPLVEGKTLYFSKDRSGSFANVYSDVTIKFYSGGSGSGTVISTVSIPDSSAEPGRTFSTTVPTGAISLVLSTGTDVYSLPISDEVVYAAVMPHSISYYGYDLYDNTVSNASLTLLTVALNMAKQDTISNHNKLDYAYLKNTPSIPSSTSDLTNDSNFIADASYVHTDNNFTDSLKTKVESSYVKDTNGIPKTDLASAVQTSLDLADSALQSYTETDPTVPSWAKESTKPSYTASEVGALADSVTHLSGDIAVSEKGTASGVATLDANGKVPTSQLPSYVDDVVEGYLYNSKWYSDSAHTTEVTGETGKIYVDLETDKTYRWSGTMFVEISESLALGETNSTAYAGDKGKANADNITAIQGLIPSDASTSNKLATASDIPSLTNYVQKSSTAGLLKNDGTVDTNAYITSSGITGKADKVSNATSGDIATLDNNGNLVDSEISSSNIIVKSNTSGLIKNDGTIDTNTYLTSSSVTGKADKVANATSGNFAGLDSNGNITDSGKKASDFLTSHQDISGKADKVANPTNGGIAKLDSNGNLVDGGILASNLVQKSATSGLLKNDGTVDTNTYLTSHQDITGKSDKVSNATNGDIAGLDSNGNLTDSGILASNVLTKSSTTGLVKNDGTIDTNSYTTTTALDNELIARSTLGVHNVLPLYLDLIKASNTVGSWSGNVYTTNNVAFTLNTDSNNNITSIKVKGTATANAWIILAPTGFKLNAGSYRFTCDGAEGNTKDWYYLYNYTTSSDLAYVGHPSFTYNGTDSIRCNYIVYSGKEVDTVIYPMIRLATDANTSYAPYAKTNTELTNDLASISADLAKIEYGTASQNYAVDDYLIMNDVLYIVTQAIVSGGTITEGTNVTRTNIGTELKTKAKVALLNNEIITRSTLGGHNLLPITAVTQVKNEATFTINSDGSVTTAINGELSVDTELYLLPVNKNIVISDVRHILSGCPSGGSTSTYYLEVVNRVNNVTQILGKDTGNGFEFDADGYPIGVRIVLKAGQTGTKTFKPMIRLSTDADATYRPYAMTNKQLTELIDNKVDWGNNSKLGAHNLLPNTAKTTSVNGVTFTVNEDGTVTASTGEGTASPSAYLYLPNTMDLDLIDGQQYILSGLSSNGSSSTFDIGIGNYGNSGNGKELTFTYNKNVNGQVFFRVYNGASANVTFSPMIRLASDTDATYQPYAKTNLTLTKDVEKIVTEFSNEVITRASLGAHNLLPNTAVSQTINGITFTVNQDKSVTVSTGAGGATQQTSFIIFEDVASWKNMIMTGTPAGASGTTYDLFAYDTVTSGENSLKGDSNVVLSNITNGNKIRVAIRIRSGVIITTPITFYPMIRLATDADTTYRPYVPTNSQLLSYRDNSILGAHNLRGRKYEELTRSGLTCVNNANGTVTISGTHSLVGGTTSFRSYGNVLDAGEYIYSLGEAALGTSLVVANTSPSELGTYKILASISPGDENVKFTYSESDKQNYPYIAVEIGIYYTVSSVNKTYKPMVRLASDANVAYQPFTMTNKQLTDSVISIESNLATVELGTASKNYAKGDYLIMNNTLYKVTTAIVAGATITVGTNVVQTSVAEELALNNIQLTLTGVGSSAKDIIEATFDNVTSLLTDNLMKCSGVINISGLNAFGFIVSRISSNLFYGFFYCNDRVFTASYLNGEVTSAYQMAGTVI